MNKKLKEAHEIHRFFHHYMGYRVCDDDFDLLSFRKAIRKIQHKAFMKGLKENWEKQYDL